MGLRVRLLRDGAQLLGTGGALRRALPLLGDAFFVMYGDSLPACAISAAVQRAFDGVEPARLDDGVPERRPARSQQRAVRSRPDRALRQAWHRRRDMRHIDYGLGVLSAGALSLHIRETSRSTSRGSTRICSRDGSWPASRSRDRFYEIGSPEGCSRPRRLPRRETPIVINDAHRSAYLQEVAEIVAEPRSPRRSSAWLRTLAAIREPRRPAVLPRRRRQRRELLARGQRFPQARGIRGLCADRQRVGADRPHQRRGLGDGVRRVAEGQPPAPDGRACSFSRSAAATSSGTSARTWSRPCSTRRGRRHHRRHRRPRRRLHGAGGRRRASSFPTVNPETRDAAHRGLPGGLWHLLVSHPRSSRRRRNGNREPVRHARGVPRSRRRDQSARSSAGPCRTRPRLGRRRSRSCRASRRRWPAARAPASDWSSSPTSRTWRAGTQTREVVEAINARLLDTAAAR